MRVLELKDVRVLAGFVLVEALGEPEKVGRFYLPPSSVGTDQSRGVVIKVGRGEVLPNGTVRPLDVAVDDLVFYSRYSGWPLKVGEREYFLIPESSIALAADAALGVLDDGSDAVVVRDRNGKLYLADEQPKMEDQVLPSPV